MKLGYIILYVPDVPKIISFYEKAFGLKAGFLDPSKQYGEMSSGETTLAFINYDLAEENKVEFRVQKLSEKPAGVELVFVSTNIEADFAKAIKHGATEYRPILKKSWGQEVGYLRDINGYLIEVCTPMAAK